MADNDEPGEQGTPLIKIRLFDRTLSFAPDNLPMDLRFEVRNKAKAPFEAFLDEGGIAIESFAVLWFVARRMNGERALPFRKAMKEFERHPPRKEEDLDLDIVGLPDDEDEEDDDEVGDNPES